MKMSFQTKCWEGSKWLRIPDSWLCNRWQFNFLSSLFKEWKQWMNCKLRRCKLSNNSVIAKIARCLTFKEKVSSYGASEASYVYISSGKSSLKMPMTSFWSSMSNSVTRQVNLLIGRKLVKNAKLWNSNETIWTIFKQCEIVSFSILLFNIDFSPIISTSFTSWPLNDNEQKTQSGINNWQRSTWKLSSHEQIMLKRRRKSSLSMYFERHYSLHLLFKNRVFVTFVTMKTRKIFWLLRSSVQNIHSDHDKAKLYLGT